MTLHLGILQTDSVLAPLQAEHGDYPAMFARLFKEMGAGIMLSIFDVQRSLPHDDSCDAYLITGSRHSVYDDLPWIRNLAGFVRDALARERKILGVCFGHQLMAHFFGGEVAPAADGWAVGVHRSRVISQPAWMQPAPHAFRLLSSHKDQVQRLPPHAELFATSDFCPLGGFTVGDKVMTVQGHPEFNKAYARELMTLRREMLGEQVYERGIQSLAVDTDERLLSRWMLNFLSLDLSQGVAVDG